MRFIWRTLIFVLMLGVTGPGALAVLIAAIFRRFLLVLPLAYLAIWLAAQFAAPSFGRVPLPCFGENLRMQSLFYCAAMRNFVTPELKAVAEDAAARVAEAYPGTITLALDGNLPFNLPLIPHLSHDDGKKLDFAFYYTDPEGTNLPGKTRAPLGYFAFETAGETCPPASLTLRWNLAWLQKIWPDRGLDETRTRALIEILAADPRITKIFVEPPLARRLGVGGNKIRFQGCRAARHDDHLHVQL